MKYVLDELKSQRRVHKSNLKKARKSIIDSMKNIDQMKATRRSQRAKIREYDEAIKRLESEVE